MLGTEACDDGTNDGQGCLVGCTVVTSTWVCATSPPATSVCTPKCGDGAIVGIEGCDDSNTGAGDGCSNTCTVEAGWTCAGAPSSCSPILTDGLCVGPETCCTGGAPGCNPTNTGPAAGYTCTGVNATTCVTTCGDLVITGTENCEDGNNIAGDGCSAAC